VVVVIIINLFVLAFLCADGEMRGIIGIVYDCANRRAATHMQ
jgi:hypothetical protein